MRRVLSVAAVLVAIALLMVLAPRLWVKNKSGKLTWNGHVMLQPRLFHGRSGKLLVLFAEGGTRHALYYAPTSNSGESGFFLCDPHSFANGKMIAITKHLDCQLIPGEAQTSEGGLRFQGKDGSSAEVVWEKPW